MLCDKLMDFSPSDLARMVGMHIPAEVLRACFAQYVDVQTILPGAQRFVLDDDAAAAADSVRLGHASSLMDADAYAKLPFDKCWFEWNYDAVSSGESGESDYGLSVLDIPSKVGILAESCDSNPGHGRLWLCWVFRPPHKQDVHVSPVSVDFRFGDPQAAADGIIQRINEQKKKGDAAIRSSVRNSHDAVALAQVASQFYPTYSNQGLTHPLDLMKAAAGDWGGETIFFKSLLILLNARNGVEYEAPDLTKINKARAKLSRAKLLDHRVVHLRGQRYERAVAGTGAGTSDRHYRVHLVRGHFKVRRSGVFWWSAFARGDASLGMVTHHYRVTRSKQKDDE